MPLAYSTLGCPGDSLDQVIATARAAGATGLELCAAANELVFPGMPAAQRAAVAGRLAGAGLTVLALASYVRVCEPTPNDAGPAAPGDGTTPGDGTAAVAEPDAGELGAEDPMGAEDTVLAELLAAIALAAELSTGNGAAGAQLRVFPGAGLEPCEPGRVPSAAMAAADLRGARRLNAAAGMARQRNVTMLLETHDSHPRAADIARILDLVDTAAPVQVIWDVMHPWRYGESPEQTAKLLAGSLAYAQFKDGVRHPGEHTVTLTLPGHGELPLAKMHALASGVAVAQGTTDPWVSLEWERKWHRDLPPVADALTALKSVLAAP